MALAIMVAAIAGCYHFSPPDPNDAYTGDIPALPGDGWSVHDDGSEGVPRDPDYYRD